MLSTEEIMAAGDNLPKLAFSRLLGSEVFGTVAYVFIIVSCLGTMNGVTMGNCRGLYAISARGQGPAPKALSKLHDKWNMPVRAALVTFGIALLWMLQWEFGLIRGKLPAIISFENDELPIITLYALYIPIFVSMMIKSKGMHPVKRFVFPALSVVACLFMIFCAFYAYKVQAIYYLIIFTVIMLIGLLFYRNKRGKSVIYRFFNE